MKPSIPKGTRDFTPDQVIRREEIFSVIRSTFRRFGFLPIETPAMESLSTLTGKYGEEGDQLLFKVLNNGDFLSKADEKALQDRNSSALIPSIARRGLRYDLTVPFARFLVMHQNELTFPFKRYQIQPVWRADRPQKGRYQEFYQCDADVAGSDSLLYEAEFIQIFDQVFHELGLSVEIRLNNRKLLAGLAEVAGISDRMTAMTVAIDKLDKIGKDGVIRELEKAGMSKEAIYTVSSVLQTGRLSEETADLLSQTAIGRKGLEEIREVHEWLALAGPLHNTLTHDLTLARGLNYYTGCIFEVVSTESSMGSIGGGGRYDDLTGVFGLKGVSGVGISFGAERIYDLMEQLERFSEHTQDALQVLIIAFDQAAHQFGFTCLDTLRKAGIHAEIYPEPVKVRKQMKYADARRVPFTVLIGEEELISGQLSLKNMRTGEQHALSLNQLINHLKTKATP
jgi:histidyl-tRNA synthetase